MAKYVVRLQYESLDGEGPFGTMGCVVCNTEVDSSGMTATVGQWFQLVEQLMKEQDSA